MEGLRLAKLLEDETGYGILINPNHTLAKIAQCADMVITANQRAIYLDIEEYINALEVIDQTHY